MRFFVKYCLILLFLASAVAKSQTNLDSLWSVWQDESNADSSRLNAIYNYAWDGFLDDLPDSAFHFAEIQYNYANSINSQLFMAKALKLQAISFQKRNDAKNTILYFKKALSIFIKLELNNEISSIYNRIGVTFHDLGNYEEALDNYIKSLNIAESINDKTSIGRAYNNIGIVYTDQNNLKKALDYYRMSLEISIEINDLHGEANSYNNMGVISQDKGELERALKFFRKALNIVTKINNSDAMAMLYNNIGIVYSDLGDLDIALEFYNKALNISKKSNDMWSYSMYLGNIGQTLVKMGDNKLALVYLIKAKELREEQNTIVGLDEITNELYKVHKNLNQKSEALEMLELYNTIQDSLATMDGIEKTKQRDFQEKFLLEKQADSIRFSNELILHQAEVKSDRIIRFSLIGGISLVFISLIIVFLQLRKTRTQKLIIESSKKQITDNINYAKKIQKTLLPEDTLIKEFFSENFILFKPKDIVGGDFYWFRSFKDLAFIACVDCTGHGVAGGFMSMMGSLLLDNIVNDEKLTPSQVLGKLNSEIIRVLKQGSGGRIQDGMDLSLCIVDKKKMELYFSGARNSIYVIDDNEVSSYKADMLPAGGSFSKKSREMNRDFSSQIISIKPNSWLIMYTDGYADQLGGEMMRSMGEKKFKEILKKSLKSELDKDSFLMNEFNRYKLDVPQVDDLLVMGFKL